MFWIFKYIKMKRDLEKEREANFIKIVRIHDLNLELSKSMKLVNYFRAMCSFEWVPVGWLTPSHKRMILIRYIATRNDEIVHVMGWFNGKEFILKETQCALNPIYAKITHWMEIPPIKFGKS